MRGPPANAATEASCWTISRTRFHSHWLVGLALSCQQPYWGLVAVICLYATAVLTNIKAKMIGEFTLAQFGPTEFKTLLSIYGLALTVMLFSGSGAVSAETVARCFFGTLIVFGVVQLTVNLWLAIRQVNQHGVLPDTSEWVTTESNSDSDRVKL